MEGFGLKIDIKKWQQLDWGIATEKWSRLQQNKIGREIFIDDINLV